MMQEAPCQPTEVKVTLSRCPSFNDWLEPSVCISQSLLVSSSCHAPISGQARESPISPRSKSTDATSASTTDLSAENYGMGQSSSNKILPCPQVAVASTSPVGTKFYHAVLTPSPSPFEPNPDLISHSNIGAVPIHDYLHHDYILNHDDGHGEEVREQEPIQLLEPSATPKSALLMSSTSTTPHTNNNNYNYSGSCLKRKAINFRKLSSYEYANMAKNGSLCCEVCQVLCATPLNLSQHLKGRHHKNTLHLLRLTTSEINSSGGRRSHQMLLTHANVRCDVCQIWCIDINAMNKHLNGKKHKTKLNAA